jgi:quercetin dioxygenase-like cupin family protein
MNRKTIRIILLMACAYTAGARSENGTAEHGSKIEIENDRVLVRRNVHPPHSVTPMHSHRAGVVVYLTDVRERTTAPDGTSKIVTHKAGEALWAPARSHTLENLGDTRVEAIEIELKDPKP